MLINNDRITVYNLKKCDYPKHAPFHPNINFPEYKFGEIDNSENNYVYEAVRNIFILNKFDYKNIDKPNWNPLGKYIKKGDTVLLKPNIVNHVNQLEGEPYNCVVTHGSLIRAILDYVYIAVGDTGKIIIGDAPMQICDFDKAIDKIGLNEIVDFYKSKNINIELLDFRCLNDTKKDYIKVDLAEKSLLHEVSNRKFMITNYDPREMKKYHNKKNNIYMIAKAALDANVIINIPKPKTHRKAGMTASMKNLIGINAKKECLAHHTKGSLHDGGDEYLNRDLNKKMKSYFLDVLNIAKARNSKFMIRVYSYLLRKINLKIDSKSKDNFFEGSWYGNDTIWRTICDINTIIKYANANGDLTDKEQRRIISFGDMIISGEGEGPLLPTKKEVGCILFGEDMFSFDMTVARLMGFDYKKIKYLNHLSEKRNVDDIELVSNNKKFNKRKIMNIDKDECFRFMPSSGWINNIEME